MEIIRRASAGGVGVLYVTHRLDEIFTIAGDVTVLRDGREVATVPTSLDHRRLVNLLVGEELTVAHHEAETLESEGKGPSGRDGQAGGSGRPCRCGGSPPPLSAASRPISGRGRSPGSPASPAQAAKRCWAPPSGPSAGPAR